MQHVPEFVDRQEAGRALAESVCQKDWIPTLVLALPKGGVPVACPVAGRLKVPLNLLIAEHYVDFRDVPFDDVLGVLQAPRPQES